jgi:hypothetical protein
MAPPYERRRNHWTQASRRQRDAGLASGSEFRNWSVAASLVAGMIALWDQQATQSGLPKPGFVSLLLYSSAQHAPGSFLDITTEQLHH